MSSFDDFNYRFSLLLPAALFKKDEPIRASPTAVCRALVMLSFHSPVPEYNPERELMRTIKQPLTQRASTQRLMLLTRNEALTNVGEIAMCSNVQIPSFKNPYLSFFQQKPAYYFETARANGCAMSTCNHVF